MHMADALLSPAVGTAFWAGAIGTIGFASRKLKARLDDRKIPLMGVAGAFIFASQMINFTIPGTGSSGHLGGGLILTILLGPHAAFLVMASVLTVQALFFADGGLLALGCNIWNLGVYPCFVAWPLIYKPLAGDGRDRRRILPASVASAVAGLQMGAFSVVLQTLLSGKIALPFGTFLLVMQPIHLAIGAVEGFVTAGVIHYVRAVRPEMLDSVASTRPLAAGISLRNVLAGFIALAVVTGGALTWFASTHPDGLEWSIERISGKGGLPGQEHGIAAAAKRLQEKIAFLPDYGFKPPEGKSRGTEEAPAWPNIDAGTSASGLIGGLLVLAMALGIGWAIRAFRGKRST
ncbi:MAG TPA: cobalamin biosynthesis protein CbiM [Deltaproteobacteria bacterium]|nr:MAG: cobalamin biosynthesis protein CbiM [Deltaproteobacteria bacterium GWA2_65_63]OGP26282.1 MAG: cobalamin biosynthesis protein CbiM [Deltaproteobacteria bacterium GWB2_65_81]OGP38454.1 MAG: cobalamin biosynthesis protein CbiM [Deltaproteobacteria bacterium GWC2_66_88]OGP79074.1 MAG: cobalamin biosynthesis protein CbiM [Deltaproteobacteria bacterium RBG_16_66_15]HAM32497.1 cobalamin biosynthesis protein CbiM [Deltaproteobacteria bacterium]